MPAAIKQACEPQIVSATGCFPYGMPPRTYIIALYINSACCRVRWNGYVAAYGNIGDALNRILAMGRTLRAHDEDRRNHASSTSPSPIPMIPI